MQLGGEQAAPIVYSHQWFSVSETFWNLLFYSEHLSLRLLWSYTELSTAYPSKIWRRGVSKLYPQRDHKAHISQIHTLGERQPCIQTLSSRVDMEARKTPKLSADMPFKGDDYYCFSQYLLYASRNRQGFTILISATLFTEFIYLINIFVFMPWSAVI